MADEANATANPCADPQTAMVPPASSSSLRTIIYTPLTTANNADVAAPPSLQVLDQLVLPLRKEYLEVTSVVEAHKLIKNMNIRGAPLIALVAILGLVVDVQNGPGKQSVDQIAKLNGADHGAAVRAYLQGQLQFLGTSRPTAVNLFNAIREVEQVLEQTLQQPQEDGDETATTSTPRERLVEALASYGARMLERDAQDCYAIGAHGALAVLEAASATTTAEQKIMVSVMTICNTGALACSTHGTALGVVRSLHSNHQQLKSVIALETRPYNQGSRLTAFELVEDQLPGAKLICDSMAASYMARHKIDAVVVGADRVCANGDTANKIGTYQLALIAQHFQVPFFVAAPRTTLDANTIHGDDIPIEERPADELRKSAQAPPGIDVWNPGFDVTPHQLIRGIITEDGVLYHNQDGEMDVKGFLQNSTTSGS